GLGDGALQAGRGRRSGRAGRGSVEWPHQTATRREGRRRPFRRQCQSRPIARAALELGGFMTHRASRGGTWWSVLATRITLWAGSTPAFLCAGGVVLVWLITGPIFGYSDTWQLVINTG